MDSFSLLKFWKGGAASSSTVASPYPPSPPTTTTVITSSTESNSDSEPDAGPFFDLEFALPSDEEDEDGNVNKEEEEEEEEEEDVNLTNDDDVYIRGQIVEINGSDEEGEIVGTTKSGQFPIPVSLLRSATKLRVLMLGLKKSKAESTSKSKQQNNTRNTLIVKLKMKAGENPILSLLTRNSSNLKQNTTKAGEEEKKEKKEKVQKYLRVLYEKAKAAKMKKKETAVVHSMPMSSSNSNSNGGVSVRSGGSGSSGGSGGGSNRKDDSLLQIQDGIQAAILHCKRSFNSSTASEELEVEPSMVQKGPSMVEETVVAASEDDGRNDVVGI